MSVGVRNIRTRARNYVKMAYYVQCRRNRRATQGRGPFIRQLLFLWIKKLLSWSNEKKEVLSLPWWVWKNSTDSHAIVRRALSSSKKIRRANFLLEDNTRKEFKQGNMCLISYVNWVQSLQYLFQHMIIVQILVGIYYLYWVVKYLFIYSSVFFYLFVYYFIYRYQQFDFLFQSELREILINYRQISWLLTDKMHICIFVSRSEQNVMFIYNTCTCINALPY